MALTGPLAANGKQALLGAQIWAGGDQRQGRPARPPGPARSTTTTSPTRRPCPASTPSCSTSTKSTSSSAALCAPTWSRRRIPVVDAEGQDLHQSVRPRCQQPNSTIRNTSRCCRPGPKPKQTFTEGFFQAAAAQNPKPKTVAIAAEDAEFARNACRRRARQRQAIWLQGRLRQELPAEHDRLLADRPRAAGRQCGSRRHLLVSAQLGRHRCSPPTSSASSRR